MAAPRPRNTVQRRALLALGALAAIGWVIGAPRLAGLWPAALRYRDLPGLAPFRMLESSGTLSGAALTVGLDAPAPPDQAQQARLAAVRANPCAALFGPQVDARLPIAFFSDFNCPNCRVLDAVLQDQIAARPDEIRLVRHQLPLLGAASTVASLAVLAADRQGGYAAMHDRLMRSRMVTDLALVTAIAGSVELDGPRLVVDMQSEGIATALDRSRAIATVFGFAGTPATVIGRTAFLGAIPAADVARIVEAELAALPMAC